MPRNVERAGKVKSVSETVYDVVIIGSGPGGYVAAVRAGQLGMKTAIVERNALGGVCLNVGCIPTKALLHSADLLDEVREGKRFGVLAPEVSFDLGAAMKHKDSVIKASTDGVAYLMKKNSVDVYAGSGRLLAPGQVQVRLNNGGEQLLRCKHILIATGARPRPLPGADFDGERILSSTDMLYLKAVPRTLLTIGAGAIGIEFASMYRAFGANVTVVEALPRIVPVEDEDISGELAKAFQRRGIKTMAGARVESIETRDQQVLATVIDNKDERLELSADQLLVAIGIQPHTQDIGLEAAGVRLNARGFIETDGYMRTGVDGVYAIGDCCATTPWLAHKASAEGLLAIEHMAGHHVQPLEYEKIPACTYCNPEIASVGLSEARARERGYDVKVGKFPFSANGKARVIGQNRFGFVKIVAEKQYDEVLGIHLIGPHVTEMIGEGALTLSHEATGSSLMHTIHAHPTLHEAVGEAAHAVATGAAIHI
jgi:dihydrolipoamide dehydrogenase